MRRILPLLFAGVLTLPAAAAAGENPEERTRLLRPERVESIASVRNLEVSEGEIRGTVVNGSEAPIEDVAVLVQHLWLWGDEYEPGSVEEDPSHARFHEIDGTIAPGERRTFRLERDAVPETSRNGRFLVLVSVGKVARDAEKPAGR